MKESLKNFVFFILFWLLFFAACRVVFLLSIISKWKEHDFSAMLLSFFHGFPMDLSAAAYFGIIPLLLWTVLFLFKKNPSSNKLLQVYTITLICLVSVLAVVDFNIYREWGTKLNYRAIHVFFKSPYEVMISSGSSPVLLSLLSGLLLIASGIFLYRKYKPKFYITNYPGLFARIVFVLFVVCCQHLTKIHFLAKAFKKTGNVCNAVLLIGLYFILKLFCFCFCNHFTPKFSNFRS